MTAIQHRPSAPSLLPPIVPASVIDDLRRGERLTLTEWRVPRGVPVFAVGRVTSKGLVPSRTGLTLLTTLSRDEVIAERRASARTGRWAARWSAVLGLILFFGGVGALKLLG